MALGMGTMIGWKRIVVTVGERIGKTHLTYAQGAAAEIVAMATIGAADGLGLPVSTTHVLSSASPERWRRMGRACNGVRSKACDGMGPDPPGLDPVVGHLVLGVPPHVLTGC